MAEDALEQWRDRVGRGVLDTSLVALIPPLLIQGWQSAQGVTGIASGFRLASAAFVTLALLRLAPMAPRTRVTAMLTIGFGFTAAAMLLEGLAPAQFVCVCMVTSLAVLLRSTRLALVMLGALILTMALAAHLFAIGAATPNAGGYVDARQPLNWLRVGLYTVFPSATMAVATSYLLNKLREALEARSVAVEQLRAEIGQRERAFHELERAQGHLVQAQKLEAIGHLAAGIAHDFNNTLSVVTLEAELLKRKGRPPEEILRGAESLSAAAERGTHLSRQLLLFGRADQSERKVVDAVQQIEDGVRTLRRLVPTEITFEVELAREPLPVRVQATELQQVVLNLGINARDAMPSGGTLRVELEHRTHAQGASGLGIAPGQYAVLTCRDTGAGMDAPTLAHVFEPFFTTKGRGRGTGLGLTNVWNIVRRAGGTVDVQSTPGAGTTFWIYVPITDAPLATPAAAGGEALSAALQGRETVLVVEDDIRIRALIVAILADAGYAVLDAPNADAALVLQREHARIDLLCTDVVMPGRPARELITELRVRHTELAVLVCSGYSEDEQIARGIERGELVHLAKPFTRKALLSQARAALDRTRAAREQEHM